MTKQNNLNVALIQNTAAGTTNDIHTHLEQQIRAAANDGAQLVVLQELHNTAYFCQTEDTDLFDLAESIPGPSTHWLAKLALELKIVITGSLFEKRASGIYHNTAVVIDSDGSLAGIYRKMHIPDDPGFYEKFYFTPGDEDFTPIQTSLGKLGVMVCWDQWFPEAARLMALAGAQLLIYPTAIGWDPNDNPAEQHRQFEAWQIIQRSHAVANSIPVLTVNRCGFEADNSGHTAGIQFWGHSFIAGPQGEIIQQASQENQTIKAKIKLHKTEQIRRIWPFLRDRRIDAYAGLTQRYRN